MKLFIVWKSDGPWEGSSIYAVCSTKKKAAWAQDQLRKRHGPGFEIQEIELNALYAFALRAIGAEDKEKIP